jgi:putative FmdB family regulatory protein
MPIYEYRCDSCGHELEKLQRMSDPELTDCPDCGKSTLNRLVSAAGFRLKGSGWYETDFKKDGKKNLHQETAGDSKADKTEKAASTDKTDSAGSGAASKAAKPDSKPAAGTSDSA